jgi:hypothetical protein
MNKHDLDIIKQAIEERDAVLQAYFNLAHEMIYNGNSFAHWYNKAKAYRLEIDNVWNALAEIGVYPDGRTSCSKYIRKKLL